jgi:putative ABC transport system ATP-binding protein
MKMLDVEQLTKYFNRGTPSEVIALDHVSLVMEENEFLVIIGSNGSGKTTLLNLVAGNYFAESGSVSIQGNDVTLQPDYARSKWIARVFQDPLKGTAPDLSILENFRLASLRTKSKSLLSGINQLFRKRVQELVSVLNLGLENKLDTLVGKLSGGQRQALTLLMATMDQPKLLLLDEPTAALDPRSSAVVMELANRIITVQQLTAILVTHNLKQAMDYGSRLIMMDSGQIKRDFHQSEKSVLQLADMQQWFYESAAV